MWILIALAILLIFYVTKDGRRRARASKRLARSGGGNDADAREALAEINEIARPNNADRFMRGYILQFHIAENRPRGETVRAIARDYEAAATAPLPERDTRVVRDFMQTVQHIWPEAHAIAASLEDQRLARAAESKLPPVAALEAAQTFSSDPQNVHDPAVNADLRRIYVRLQELNGQVPACNAIVSGNAARTLEQIRRGGYVSTFGATENKILDHVWARAQALGATDAVIDALDSAVENGHVVCANGRMARVLDSLVAIDSDPVIGGGVSTFETYRNQIFDETAEIIKDVDYDTLTDETAAQIRATIAETVRGYGDKIGKKEIEHLLQECFIYACV